MNLSASKPKLMLTLYISISKSNVRGDLYMLPWICWKESTICSTIPVYSQCTGCNKLHNWVSSRDKSYLLRMFSGGSADQNSPRSPHRLQGSLYLRHISRGTTEYSHGGNTGKEPAHTTAVAFPPRHSTFSQCEIHGLSATLVEKPSKTSIWQSGKN